MKTVFLFVDKPAFLGDLLNTGYIRYLSEKYRVIVFVNKSGVWAQNLDYFQSPSITYIDWKIENAKLLGVMKFIRFSCIREFDYLKTAQYYRKRRGQDSDNTFLRIVSKPFSKFLTSSFFYKLELFLVKKSRLFGSYIEKYKPSLVIVATPGLNTMEAEAVLLAKKHGIKSVSVDCNWDGLETRVTRVRPTDYFIAWHEPMKKEAVEIHHFNPRRVFVSGPVRFDYHFTNNTSIQSRKDFLSSKNLDSNNKTILYSTQKGHLFEEAFLKKIIDLRNSGSIPNVNILVRVHPVAKKGRFTEFSGLENVYVEKPPEVMANSDFINLKQSLLYCDININYSSSISLEAILLDKPVINYIEPGMPIYDYDHYRPLVETRAVKLISNHPTDLAKAINEYLDNPNLDRENREKMAKIYFPFCDGLCSKRSVDFLQNIIDEDLLINE